MSMIRVIQMGQNDAIQRKHLTPEQQQQYEEITSRVYPSEVMQKVKQLYPKEWTQEDQRKVDEKYAFIKQELGRLVALGADPASPEAQTVARLSEELNFAQGDPDIEASVNQWWEEFYKLPEEGRPFDTAMYTYTEQEHTLLKQAKTIFQQSQPKSGNT
jgi:hypothetical protein